jgi:hypothetical protein
MTPQPLPNGSDMGFAATRWTLVMAAARGSDSSRAAEALTELCRTYWYPLYAFLRRRLSVALPPIGADVKEADVVLTPNPRLIELRPEVDRHWGGEVVFRKVHIRRLDAAEQSSREAVSQ